MLSIGEKKSVEDEIM